MDKDRQHLGFIERPDFYRVDLHSALVGSGVVPSRVPLVFGVIKRVGGMGVGVGPGFAARTVGEIASGAADCNVQDQVKILIERSICWLVDPRVVLVLPSSFAEEVLVRHVNIEDDVLGAVDVCLQSFRGPEETVDVHLVG